MPAAELAGELLELEDVAPDLADLPERLHDVSLDDGAGGSSPGRWSGALSAARRRRARGPRSAGPWRALTRGERVADVADEVGYSRRRLSTLVRQETGLAPKEYQRWRGSRRPAPLLGPHGRWPRWPRCAGTPTRATSPGTGPTWPAARRATWLREEFPFLQDHEAAAQGSVRDMTAADTRLWHSMSFADADRMIAWLTAVGFTEHATTATRPDPIGRAPRRVAVAGRAAG